MHGSRWGWRRLQREERRHGGGERFALLLDARTGLPDPWATRYCALLVRSKGGSVNSMAKALRSIALSVEWAAARGIDLTQRIDSGDLLSQEESVDLVNWLRVNRSVAARKVKASVRPPVAADTHYTRVVDLRAYLSWRAEVSIHRIPIASGRYREAAQKLADWRRMIGGSYVAGLPARDMACLRNCVVASST